MKTYRLFPKGSTCLQRDSGELRPDQCVSSKSFLFFSCRMMTKGMRNEVVDFAATLEELWKNLGVCLDQFQTRMTVMREVDEMLS